MQNSQATTSLRNIPLFLFLLPAFFVFHGFVSNYDAVSFFDAVVLTAQYILTAIILTAICWLFYRNRAKASITSFFLLCIYFFFGPVEDLLKEYFSGTF